MLHDCELAGEARGELLREVAFLELLVLGLYFAFLAEHDGVERLRVRVFLKALSNKLRDPRETYRLANAVAAGESHWSFP